MSQDWGRAVDAYTIDFHRTSASWVSWVPYHNIISIYVQEKHGVISLKDILQNKMIKFNSNDIGSQYIFST